MDYVTMPIIYIQLTEIQLTLSNAFKLKIIIEKINQEKKFPPSKKHNINTSF